MSPKRILIVDLFICPSVQIFLEYISENKNLFQIVGLTGFCIEGS